MCRITTTNIYKRNKKHIFCDLVKRQVAFQFAFISLREARSDAQYYLNMVYSSYVLRFPIDFRFRIHLQQIK